MPSSAGRPLPAHRRSTMPATKAPSTGVEWLLGHREQQGQQQHGSPDASICVVSCSPSLDERSGSARRGTTATARVRPERNGRDGNKGDDRHEPVGRAEEQGDRDDRQQLADRAGREQVGARAGRPAGGSRAGSAAACPAPSSSARWRPGRTPGRDQPAYSSPTTPAANAAVRSQARAARRPGSARSSRWSTSYPARRNRNPSPTSARICAFSGEPRSRPCGPISMPPTSRSTTWGMRGPGSSATRTGASTATTAIASSVPSVECTSTTGPPPIAGPDRRP